MTRMRKVVDISTSIEYTPEDGAVSAHISDLGVVASGKDEATAKQNFFEVLQARLDTDEAFQETFGTWAQAHVVEMEMTDEEIKAEEDVLNNAKQATKNFAELDASTFDAAIAQARPLLVDFWAPWCKPCLFAAPVLKEIHDEMSEEFDVAKVNVEDHGEFNERFDIQGIPCFIVFKEGAEVDRIVGFGPKAEFKAEIERVLAKN